MAEPQPEGRVQFTDDNFRGDVQRHYSRHSLSRRHSSGSLSIRSASTGVTRVTRDLALPVAYRTV